MIYYVYHESIHYKKNYILHTNKNLCKIFITYKTLYTYLHLYVKLALHMDSNSNIKINFTYKILHTDLHLEYYVQI